MRLVEIIEEIVHPQSTHLAELRRMENELSQLSDAVAVFTAAFAALPERLSTHEADLNNKISALTSENADLTAQLNAANADSATQSVTIAALTEQINAIDPATVPTPPVVPVAPAPDDSSGALVA